MLAVSLSATVLGSACGGSSENGAPDSGPNDAAPRDATVNDAAPDIEDATTVVDAGQDVTLPSDSAADADGPAEAMSGGDASDAPDAGDRGDGGDWNGDASDAGEGALDASDAGDATLDAGPRACAFHDPPPACAFDGGDAGGVSFTTKQELSFPEIGIPETLAIGDIDGDGRNDIVLTNSTYPTNKAEVLVFRQASGGGFPSFTSYSFSQGNFDLAVADVNSDGRADVLQPDLGGALDVRLGQADGTLGAVISYPLNYGSAMPTPILPVDYNCDGRRDVISFAASRIWLFPQTDAGTLGPVTHVDTVGKGGATVGDVNGDGFLDMVGEDFAHSGMPESKIAVIPGTGPGTFDLPYETLLDDGGAAGPLAVGDLNGDGLDDVVVSSDPTAGRVMVSLQKPRGTLQPPVSYASMHSPTRIAIADVNMDCRNDVVVQHSGYFAVGVYLQTADGTLANEVVLPSVYGQSVLAVGDLNHDGKPDIAVADQQKLVLFYNTH